MATLPSARFPRTARVAASLIIINKTTIRREGRRPAPAGAGASAAGMPAGASAVEAAGAAEAAATEAASGEAAETDTQGVQEGMEDPGTAHGGSSEIKN